MNTKEKVLRAAVKVFAEKGFKATTTRDICSEANCNINSVSYYFSGKDLLYKAVLEFMFEETEKFQPDERIFEQDLPPEKLLEIYIHTFCKVMFGMEDEIDQYLAVLFSKEVANPSPFLDEMVERYIVPGDEAFVDILKQIMGTETPDDVIRDVKCSILGQIFYYAFAWPIFIRSNPDHPGMETQIDHLAEHVTRFSLGGIKAMLKEQQNA